jgi:hypothetical protein
MKIVPGGKLGLRKATFKKALLAFVSVAISRRKRSRTWCFLADRDSSLDRRLSVTGIAARLLGFVIVTVLSVSAASAQHLVEYDVERRVQLTFTVSPSEAQKFLPAPWQVASMPRGPSEGANFAIVFRNRLLTINYDAAGTPQQGDQDWGAVIFVYTKNPETGESGLRVVRTLSANPVVLPGPYGNSKLARVKMEQTTVTQETTEKSGLERWQIEDDSGTLRLLLRYQVGPPLETKPEIKMYGGKDPKFFRIYRTEKGADLVKSMPTNLNRVDEFQFGNTLAEFTEIFDGSEKLVSISVEPWYLRHIFLPTR